MTTYLKAPGVARIHAGASIGFANTGHMRFTQKPSDYEPPYTAAVNLWLDSGDSAVTTARDGVRAQTGFSLRSRAATSASQSAPSFSGNAFSAPTSTTQTIVYQNNRPVFAFSAASPGITGTCGPVQARWTLMFFLRLDAVCDTFGSFPGVGNQNLLSMGGSTISVPRGGAVAVANQPLGAQAGWP